MIQRALGALALAVVVVGCSKAVPADVPGATQAIAVSPGLGGQLTPTTVIDGYKVADPFECTTTDDFCDDVLQVATASVVKLGVAPESIVARHLYDQYIRPGDAVSGSAAIVVFDLKDGSRKAVGVLCGIGPCQFMGPHPLDAPPPVDHGPLVDASPSS